LKAVVEVVGPGLGPLLRPAQRAGRAVERDEPAPGQRPSDGDRVEARQLVPALEHLLGRHHELVGDGRARELEGTDRALALAVHVGVEPEPASRRVVVADLLERAGVVPQPVARVEVERRDRERVRQVDHAVAHDRHDRRDGRLARVAPEQEGVVLGLAREWAAGWSTPGRGGRRAAPEPQTASGAAVAGNRVRKAASASSGRWTSARSAAARAASFAPDSASRRAASAVAPQAFARALERPRETAQRGQVAPGDGLGHGAALLGRLDRGARGLRHAGQELVERPLAGPHPARRHAGHRDDLVGIGAHHRGVEPRGARRVARRERRVGLLERRARRGRGVHRVAEHRPIVGVEGPGVVAQIGPAGEATTRRKCLAVGASSRGPSVVGPRGGFAEGAA
jgi:hypothetical protein